ncbi:hypothetical protein BP6252_03598 [Coleophoma cylindrospora]|uniref:Transcription factor domain-containing protein n=1 Tax=Coleophoma cylindrospora TaxID=1849047 RepID=A0A3D8S843_9HELO|nr:hypothetical protein BP6252_03598 [Coleophoma cylindrospora]
MPRASGSKSDSISPPELVLQGGDPHTSTLPNDTETKISDDIDLLFTTDLATIVAEVPPFSDFESTSTDLSTMISHQPLRQLQHVTLPSPMYSEPSQNSSFLSELELYDSLPFDIIEPKFPKAFQPRRLLNQQISLNRRFIICTLRSYPSMLLSGTRLPPFIHPKFMVKASEHSSAERSLPGSLGMCLSIVNWYSVKNKENSEYIWRAIRMEQERISAQCSQFDSLNAVAALQAMAIYTLLRLSEDNEDLTNFDVPLISTMLKVAERSSVLAIRYSGSDTGGKITWEGWILAESLRRTVIVLFIVDLIFDMSAANPASCDGTQFARMTLPSARNIWQASTRLEFEKAFSTQPIGLGLSNHLTYGDLLKFQRHVDTGGERLDNWLSSVDDFGTLVMAAASLSDERNMSRK